MFVIKEFLNQNKLSKLYSEFDDYYQSHPNFPSLFSITDSFSLLGITNVAARIEKDQISELPPFFLAYVKKNPASDDELATVSKKDGALRVCYNDSSCVTLSMIAFEELWNGIVVAIEYDDTIKTREPASSGKQPCLEFLFGSVALLWLVKALLLENTLFFALNSVVSVLGFIVSVIILKESYRDEPGTGFVSKVCASGKNTSCDSVIRSEKSRITAWLEFSDLPLLFFGSSLLVALFDSNSFSAVGMFGLGSLPLIGYSIWIQRVVLKKWCLLCLIVSALVLVQATMFLLAPEWSIRSTVGFLLSVGLVAPVWFILKQLYRDRKNVREENYELRRFKKDHRLFDTLQRELTVPIEELDLLCVRYGNETAPVTLDVMLSPGCRHCHLAFQQALVLFRENPEQIAVRISYNMNPENQGNGNLIVARTILALSQVDMSQAREALEDWHMVALSGKDSLHKNLQQWLKKWEQEFVSDNINHYMGLQFKWCSENDFHYTPVKILNGKQFPREYQLSDLKYFLSEWSEEQLVTK